MPFSPVEPGFTYFKLSFLENPWLKLQNDSPLTPLDTAHVLDFVQPVFESDLVNDTSEPQSRAVNYDIGSSALPTAHANAERT